MCGELQRDYSRISGLLSDSIKSASDENSDGYLLERAMLGMSSRWLNVQYQVASRFSERTARAALLEMSQIVERHTDAPWRGPCLATLLTARRPN